MRRVLGVVAAAAIALTGCEGDDGAVEPRLAREYPPAAACALFDPEVLIDGSAPGEARPFPDDEPTGYQMAWGEGLNQVVVGRGREVVEASGGTEPFPYEDWPDYQSVVKDGIRRQVVPVGDPGQIRVEFVQDGCPYVLWISHGHTLDAAMTYAERF